MVIRSRMAKGKTYYLVQASYRAERGKAVRRMLASLGPHSTIDEALEALDSEDRQDRAILTARRWHTLSSEARAALGATERLQLEATERRIKNREHRRALLLDLAARMAGNEASRRVGKAH
jgi:hypothetical protein